MDSPALNIHRNIKEFASRTTVLTSTPKRITLGTHNSCNAKCIFCLEGAYSRFSLQHYKEFFEAKLGRFLRGAESITFTGFGELLWVPGIEEFLDYLNRSLPDTWKIVTTNGTPLKPSVVDRLLDGRYIVQISLHASRPELHERLTQLKGQFHLVLSQLEDLLARRSRRGRERDLRAHLFNCLTTENIDDLPEFIRLGWRLGVQEIRAYYMTMFVPEHMPLSCFFDQERSNRSLRQSWDVAQKLATLRDAVGLEIGDFVVRLPPFFGEGAAESPAKVCSEPWNHIYVELQGSVIPCCHWGGHIGNLKDGPEEIDSIWNSSFYQDLREGMAKGTPHRWCANCVQYRGYNVNDVLCHVTNRPDAQKRILEAVESRRAVRPSAGPVQALA